MTDPIRLSLEQSIEVQDALRRNNVSLAELKKLTSGDNLRKAIDVSLFRPQYRSIMFDGSDRKHLGAGAYEYVKSPKHLAHIPDDLSMLPEEMKNGVWYCFLGSSRVHRGKVFMPSVYWYAPDSKWLRREVLLKDLDSGDLDNDLTSNVRVVFFED
ncbi:MAG: hypothetical protein ACYC8S_02970 [Minisyncoccota bacterium]